MPEEDSSNWSRLAGIGFEFIAAVMIFGGIGWWLDTRFHARPWLLIAGCGLGFGIGLWLMIKAARRMFHD